MKLIEFLKWSTQRHRSHHGQNWQVEYCTSVTAYVQVGYRMPRPEKYSRTLLYIPKTHPNQNSQPQLCASTPQITNLFRRA